MWSHRCGFKEGNVNLLFAGFIVDSALFDRVAEADPKPQYAAQNYQKNLVKALEKGEWKSFSVFGSVPCSPYPRNKSIYLPPKVWGCDRERFSGPAINLPGLNFIIRAVVFFFYLMFWSLRNRGDRVVCLYALHSPHVLPLLVAKIVWGVKAFVYVPDLPMYMSFGERKGRVKRILKSLDSRFLLWACNKFEGRVVITSTMYDYVDRNGSIILDTIVDESHELNSELGIEMPKGVNFTYTGGLVAGYGVLEALNYFSNDYAKNKGWNLLIFGTGPLRDLCVQYSDAHENIYFYGQVSIDSSRVVQSRSDFLLNLRDPSDARFNYSYPSKVTEYLLSGIPVITTKIAGIPEDFHPYLNFVDLDNFEVDSLVDNYKEIKTRANEGREYLILSRSFESQFKKMVGLIKGFFGASDYA